MTELTPDIIDKLLAVAEVNYVNDKLLHNNNSKSAQFVVPDNYKVIDTEPYEETPNLFRGTFKTGFLADFLAYLNDNSNEATAVFFDAEKTLSATAIIDLGSHASPEWAKHRAELKLGQTPEYAGLLKLANQTLSQRNFIDFVEDYIERIVFFGADDKPIAKNKALTALRKLTVASITELNMTVEDHQYTASSFDMLEMKSKDEVVPTRFEFTCVPYFEISQQQFNCRLRAVLDDKVPQMKYRVVNADDIQLAISQEFEDRLRDALGDSVRIYAGSMDKS